MMMNATARTRPSVRLSVRVYPGNRVGEMRVEWLAGWLAGGDNVRVQ